MKRRVEAGDLRDARKAFRDGIDCREIVRLMQRRERHQLAQMVEDIAGHAHGRRKACTSMHDAMTDAENRRTLVLPAQPGRERVERSASVAHRGTQRLLANRCSALVLRHESRRRADAFDLAARGQAPRLGGRSLIDAELQARRACVQHQRVVIHGFTARACAASTATAQLAILARTESARLVRMMGTLAPRTRPALSEFARNVSSLARMLAASRSGASRMSGSPATSEVMPLVCAASLLMALSNASGPSIRPPLICPRSAILHSAAASSVAGILEVTVSTAASTATFGRAMASDIARS